MLKCSRVLVRQRRRKSWGLLYWARSSTAFRIRTPQLTSLTSHRSLWICHPWFAFWLFFSTVTSHCSHLPHFTDISAQVSLITKLRSETIEFAHYTSLTIYTIRLISHTSQHVEHLPPCGVLSYCVGNCGCLGQFMPICTGHGDTVEITQLMWARK